MRVALTVDPTDDALEALFAAVPIDMLQLHGRESPERVAELRARFGRPVMKAVGIAGEADLAQIDDYAGVADQILVDARPPRGADAAGRQRRCAFDWRLLRGPALEAAVDAGRRADAGERGRGGAADRRRAGGRVLGGREPSGLQGRRPHPGLRARRARGASGSRPDERSTRGAGGAKNAADPRGSAMNLQQPNSFRTGPDERGRFGDFGGRFVSETLMPLILDLEAEYEKAKTDAGLLGRDGRSLEALRRPAVAALLRRAADRAAGRARRSTSSATS